jgi:prepilin-type N-terminal cleavage/methylation domain-containing protein
MLAVRARKHISPGFTLIEMSVVVIVIALLVGGVVLGRDLVRAADIRSVIADSDKLQSAIYAFRQKYQYLPGDFPRAETYWGTDSTSVPCSVTTTNTVGKVATCNGNGNGKIDSPVGGQVCAPIGASSLEQESYRMWQHLSDAGMIRGIYTGVNGPGGALHGVPGVNIPASSKIDKVGFQFMNFGGVSTTIDWQIGARFGNVMFIGRQDDVSGCYETNQPFLSSLELYGIDVKSDDGLPGTGNIRAYSNNGTYCASSSDPTTATYSMNTNARSCSIIQLLNW